MSDRPTARMIQSDIESRFHDDGLSSVAKHREHKYVGGPPSRRIKRHCLSLTGSPMRATMPHAQALEQTKACQRS